MANNHKIRAGLKVCRMFSGLLDEDLDALCTLAHAQSYERNRLLFSEGEAAAGFYVVRAGRVKIYKLSADGKERILHVVHSGDSFAEAAIFGDGRYPAFAETLCSTELIFLPGQEFLTLLHQRPGIAIHMIAGLSQFLRQFAHQIEELTFKDVPARLAGYLLKLTPEPDGSYQLPVNKSQLASNLGTVSETLSRSLRKLADEELILVEGKRIKILDRTFLETLSRKTI
jgi:CRP/FNR family transcriptional regulator